MRSKLSTVGRIRLRGVAGDGIGKTGVANILTGYRVVVDVGVVLIVVVREVTIQTGDETVVVVLIALLGVLTRFVCQRIVDVVVVVVDSVVNSSSGG